MEIHENDYILGCAIFTAPGLHWLATVVRHAADPSKWELESRIRINRDDALFGSDDVKHFAKATAASTIPEEEVKRTVLALAARTIVSLDLAGTEAKWYWVRSTDVQKLLEAMSSDEHTRSGLMELEPGALDKLRKARAPHAP